MSNDSSQSIVSPTSNNDTTAAPTVEPHAHHDDAPSTNSPPMNHNSPPPPRLIITKMILDNFKSYAGVKTIGPFHKCFSSIVGPNGSGKSNVIDAMLFVFGKRAKKLRLNKVSELIHSSAAFQKNPLEYAQVSVYFQEIIDTGDGDEDYIIVPDSEIVVTRVAKRDNSSQYKLDGKNCSFRQVATFLNSKGIDLDNNRFLILQGEVEMISMMPPKGKTENDEGLLEYLEDIIGSNQYVEQTNEAAQKVEELTELRQEKLNRVKAVEKEKEGLEGAKLEAEALLNKEREIRKKKNILYQIHKHACQVEFERMEEKRSELSTQLEEERAKLDVATKRVKEIENGLSTQHAEYEEAHAELVKTKEEFASYERRDIQLREEIKHGKEAKKKLSAKAEKEANKQVEAEEKAMNAEESIPLLEKELQELEDEKIKQDAKLEEIFQETRGVTEKLRRELEEKTQELAPVVQERSIFQANLDTAMTEVNLLEDVVTRAKEQVDNAEQELDTIDSKQDQLRKKLASFEDELVASKQRILDAEKEDADLAEAEKVLSKKYSDVTAQSEEAKAALQSGMTRSKAVTGILKAARKGNELADVGILGRLGDLATISDQYDVAISTACGYLDHIVVQTTAGAQRCLEFLRKHGLGRANFIPLDKMKKGAHDRVVETPEGAPRLFDLITPSNYVITPALYLGVGNTLVAPDLETATRWAYDFGKRWRVVTLDGNLIEISGTMQGGGKSVRRGGMRFTNSSSSLNLDIVMDGSEDECKRLEHLAEKALEDMKQCKNQRRDLAVEIRDLKKKIKTFSIEIPKLSMEIASCDTTREELTKSLPQLRAQCVHSDEDTLKLKTAKSNVEKCKSEMASCAMLASKLEADVARLQKSILDAGGPRQKKQRKICEDVVAKLNSVTTQLNSAKVLVTSSRKAAEKAKVAKENAEQELEVAKLTLEAKKEEFKKLEQEAFAVMQAYEQVQAFEAEKKKGLECVLKETENLRKMQSDIKCIEVEIIAKIESCTKSVHDIQRKMEHWEHELTLLREAQGQDDEYDMSDDEDDVMESNENGDNESDRNDVVMDDVSSDNKTIEKANRGFIDESSLPIFNECALEQYDKSEVTDEIASLEKERDCMAKNANMTAIAEYRRKESDYLARVAELDEVTEARNNARTVHEELRRLRLDKFMEGFGEITLKLKEMYQMITLGGDAELELVDSLDPFSEGIVFSVRPPKKSWKNISNLSGGEKTLSSLALVFALHHYKPTPLYVMDEIDAALDFRNVSIVANYIKERTKNAQFIIISLRNNMFELADRLVGIYKTNNCTKSITIDPKAFSNQGQTANCTTVTALND
eukprot:CAMPEP_0176486162 /NCGR_PEP_ID=MMETSP0200_2-20121128/5422_1 /TAXON_ID=947934 /ORGANISM="Chaetoceros sp., Strain GSL56" /LENGTH=1331 /DNA_ID=CAMNT_0017882847 /DNA_START=84 /DNA_END=4076 /DNA_ORIENTATION=-